MSVITTARLRLRQFTLADAPFILRIVNDPSWLRGIGDRGVRSLADAERYLEQGPLAMYQARGHGLWAIEPRAGGGVLGMCGLLWREELADVDLGYALLPEHCGRGYAREAAAACLQHAAALGLRRVIAVVNPDNQPSQRVLAAIGMREDGEVSLAGARLRRFAWRGAAADERRSDPETERARLL